MADEIDNYTIQEFIKNNEGYRGEVYIDSAGIPTGGWGHAFIEGSRLSLHVCMELFAADFQEAMLRFRQLNLPAYGPRKMVLVDMIFNMGVGGVLTFEKMLSAIGRGDYVEAARQILDSKYARLDCPARAIRNAKIMETGETE